MSYGWNADRWKSYREPLLCLFPSVGDVQELALRLFEDLGRLELRFGGLLQGLLRFLCFLHVRR